MSSYLLEELAAVRAEQAAAVSALADHREEGRKAADRMEAMSEKLDALDDVTRTELAKEVDKNREGLILLRKRVNHYVQNLLKA